MRNYVLWLLLAVTPLTLACNASDPPATNFTDYRTAFSMAVAAYFQRCGLLDQARAAALASSSLLAIAPELGQTIDEEVRIGRVQLTTDCFAPLKDASCDVNDAFAAIESCTTGGKQYVPHVKPGGLCRLQGECIDGFCDLGAVKRPCGMGTCTPFLTLGTQCGAGKGQCNPDKASCWQGSCRALGGPGADCASDADCDAASTCANQSGKQKCAARQKNLPTGSNCDPGQSPGGCKAGDHCLQSAGGKDYVCTSPLPLGSACYTKEECTGSAVCVGADMAMSKRGQCLPQGRINDKCTDAGAVCQLTLYCSKASGTCKPAGDVNAACEMEIGGAACLSGVCTAGVCRDRAPDGSTCSSGSGGECQSGVCDRTMHCVSVCAPLR